MKKMVMIILAVILIIGSLIYWLTQRDKNIDGDFAASEKVKVEKSQDSNSNEDQDIDETIDDIPSNFTDTTDKQKEFSKKLKEMNDEIKKCQQTVNAQFPIEKLETNAPAFKNIQSLKVALDNFYQAVARKMSKSNEFMQFLENLPESEVDSKRLYKQLSEVEDCGDFEEESIIDMAITAAQDKKWSAADRKDLVSTLIKNFRDQLNTPLGLHQVVSKVEILRNLVDEEFISSKNGQDLNNLQQLLDNSENEFKNNLPTDILDNKYPSSREISDMKHMENEIVEKVRDQFLDTLTNVENNQ
ncbi:MAG: hypothetical protein QE271_08455 [Bacteriovoracaceae bacterium]|nr:hypothetical protein [Bacteriovoracaceae bacterium]